MSASSDFDPTISQINNPQKKKTQRKRYRLFNLGLLVTALTPMLGVGLFNYLVDPYDVFDTPNYFGINQVKPKKDNNDRLFKASDIIRLKPKTIFLGSSRAKQGLDPEHPALKSLQPVYNLSINGPNAYEVLRYLEHALANQPELKEVVFGLDFFMFNKNLKNQPSFSEARLGRQSIELQDFLNSTFSLDVLSASQKTISDSVKDPNKNDDYGKNGFMPNRQLKKGETEWRFKSGIELYYRLHSTYELSDEYLDNFKKIVEICQKKNIDLKIFISPSHAIDLEAIRATGRWEVYERWLREVVKITPVWDFYGYNSITTEPISNNMKNYADNSHYTKEIGDLVLDKILNFQAKKVPQDFGILLTPENVEVQIQKLRRDRALWVEKNPQEAELAVKLKQKFDQQQEKSKQRK